MDRLFLDANILFSAAYRPNTGLLKLWRLKDVTLCSSHYAVEEARANLEEEAQKDRLTRMLRGVELFDAAPREVIGGARLPEKDVPILLGAIEARVTHLVSGDLQHFGPISENRRDSDCFTFRLSQAAKVTRKSERDCDRATESTEVRRKEVVLGRAIQLTVY